MDRRTFIRQTGAAGLITIITPSCSRQAFSPKPAADLEQSFLQPPATAFPQNLWFWMNGHVTKEGITLDLEAMKAVGIGGVYNFDAGTGIPKGPVEYLSQEWLDLKKHAFAEAKRLGLEFTLHNCPGWSSSGGPWITPELAMQQFTWSEAYLKGGQNIRVQLPKPFHKLNYYRDVVVLAFPSLQGEAALQSFRVSASGGPASRQMATGEDPTGLLLQPLETKDAWVQFDMEQPYEARSLSFIIASLEKGPADAEMTYLGNRTSVVLEASDDGQNFRTVETINTGTETELRLGEKFITYDLPPVTARYFRLRSSWPRRITQVRFSGITRLHQFMEKAGYRYMFTGEGISPLYHQNKQDVPATSLINLSALQDVSDRMNQEGFLEWNAPAGNWTILRIGFTPTGTLNRSAPETGVGLECDKYSREAFDFHFQHMMQFLLPVITSLKGKVGLEIDSYEVGSQTWTALFPKEFQQRRGYNLLAYLPALTGRVVGTVAQTERFLWDFRRTQADLIADNYYSRFHELCHQHGLSSSIQPYDRGPMEEMQIGARVDINLGEFWNGLSSIFQNNKAMRRTPKLAAAIAHTNGKKLVGAESFTGEPESARWQQYPFGMKALGDKAFTDGINRIIIHRNAHQPHPTAVPGMTMGPWGIHFDRTVTWWKQGRAWLSYLARCQGLLQQGLFVADLVYFTGEEANIYTKVLPEELHPVPPAGYDYDLINAETIFNHVTIDNGRMVLPDGMSYRVLVLQDYKAITKDLLLKLKELVTQGMTLVGARPEYSLGLKDYGDEDAAFLKTVQELWGAINGDTVTENRLGKGRVTWGISLNSLLDQMNIPPDFDYTSRSGDAPIRYIHRTINGTEVYFLSNQRRSYEELVCSFRVKGKQPEMWEAATGEMKQALVYEVLGNQVRLPVQLGPYGSVFVMFRSPAAAKHLLSVSKEENVVQSTQPFPAMPRKTYPQVSNHFTITLWVKPETNIMLQPSGFMQSVKAPWTDYFALYPPPGRKLYGVGHATCGLAAGRNGLAVWEHGAGVPELVLSAPAALSGWNHVALVYRAGVPALFLNGELLKKGEMKDRIVHPGLGEAYLHEGASYYNGDRSEPQLFTEALPQQHIRRLAEETLPEQPSSPFVVEPYGSKIPALLFWQNGTYRLRYSSGQRSLLTISGLMHPFEIGGSWLVHFPPGMGAPVSVVLPKLGSLHRHPDDGVKYFSGTATYSNMFLVSAGMIGQGKRLFLDLGRVEVIAEVKLNGKDLGILWQRPYRLDITDAVQPGENLLEVQVTNLWPNRLIGDERLPEVISYTPVATSGGLETLFGGAIEKMPEWYEQGKPKPDNGRITFTTWKHYTKDSPLLESGLIGPVVISMGVVKEV